MKRHQIKMLQTEVGLDKRKEVGLAGLFFWHQLVHYYSALMAHFSTGVDNKEVGPLSALIHAEGSFKLYFSFKARFSQCFFEIVYYLLRRFEMAGAPHADGDHSHRL